MTALIRTRLFPVFMALIVSGLYATPGPYDEVSLVTHIIDWPYNASTYGNDRFQQGSRRDGDTDSLLLALVDKQRGLRFPTHFWFGVAHAA